MKIYFSGSIKGVVSNKEMYAALVEHLKKYGTVLTEHVASKNVFGLQKGLTDEDIFEQDLAWLKESAVVVADVSVPSLGVGWEIAKAEELKKKMLCIYQKQDKKISSMIIGNKHLTVKEYEDIIQAAQHIDDFFLSFRDLSPPPS